MGSELVHIPTRTEPRCKICTHHKRLEIEKLLVMQHKHECFGEEKVTYQFIIDYAMKTWDFYLTLENLQNHLDSHFQLKKMAKRAADKVNRASDKLAKSAVLSEIMAELNAEDALNEVMAFGLKNMREDEGVSVTVDHLLKAADLKLKRSNASAIDAFVDLAARAATIGMDILEEERGKIVNVEEGEYEEC